jgi:hypothetical protein
MKFHLLNIKKYAKTRFFCILKVTDDFGTDTHPDPLVRGTRIRGSGSASGSVPKKCHASGTLLQSIVSFCNLKGSGT